MQVRSFNCFRPPNKLFIKLFNFFKHMINRTFEGPQDMYAGYLTNTDFILKILNPEVGKYDSKSKKEVKLFAPRKRKSIGLDFFLDNDADGFVIPLNIKSLKSLKERLRQTMKIGDDFYCEFDEDKIRNLEEGKQYYILSNLRPLLFIRTEFGSDACGFIIRDMRKKYEGKLEHWVDHYLANKGRPWTAHIKLQGQNRGKLIKRLYKQIAGHYTFAKEK